MHFRPTKYIHHIHSYTKVFEWQDFIDTINEDFVYLNTFYLIISEIYYLYYGSIVSQNLEEPQSTRSYTPHKRNILML